MPEDSKKTHKGKHEAKDQRKPRSRHVPSEKSEKKIEKKVENQIPKVPNKPVYEDPGPEFYKNLKRETEEILKITEEGNSKYKKKEIQNNWSKYEMPIDSYEEIDEQENLGADYEKLIQAPLSVGGHFQFKHEKSWDTDTGPSLYDKYFEINMENLATAISTIPFFERNNIDESIFSETDLLNMNNRAIKYKRKYYNDKSYTTPEIESQESILNSIREDLSKPDDTNINDNQENKSTIESDIILESKGPNVESKSKNNDETEAIATISPKQHLQEEFKLEQSKEVLKPHFKEKKDIDDIDELILTNAATVNVNTETNIKVAEEAKKIEVAPTRETKKDAEPPKDTKSVIESPEDLEKWLDDFLEG